MSWFPTLAYCPNCGEQAIAINHDIYEDNAGDACLCTMCWNGYFGIDAPYSPADKDTLYGGYGMKANYLKEKNERI